MTAAGTFTSTGYLENSSSYFDVPQISFDREENDDNRLEHEVLFVLSPSENTIPGECALILRMPKYTSVRCLNNPYNHSIP
jgi:hypothetical protein